MIFPNLVTPVEPAMGIRERTRDTVLVPGEASRDDIHPRCVPFQPYLLVGLFKKAWEGSLLRL